MSNDTVMLGEEEDLCDCGHMYCYHCDDDLAADGMPGCMVAGCECPNTWQDE